MAYFHYAALYRCWANMLQRTGNPNNTRYADYGGRGIKVCERWADKKYGLDHFIEDMGPLPDGKTLDRIDPNGNYEPANCRWASASEQARNTRRRRLLMVDGKEVHILDLAKKHGLDVRLLHERIYYRGWPIEKALSVEKFSGKHPNCWKTVLERNAQYKERSHCSYGHEYTEKNSYIHKGIRHCRRCRTLWMRYKNSGKPGAWSDFAQGAQ